MADYKQDKLLSKQRARFVTIKNEVNSVPSIEFVEEIVTLEGTTLISAVPVGVLTENFTDPSVQFPLLHPVDGTQVGTATYGDAYTILNSLYRFLAEQRDLGV